VISVPGYRSKGPGSISAGTTFSEKWLEVVTWST
jgi:hypothetical protein